MNRFACMLGLIRSYLMHGRPSRLGLIFFIFVFIQAGKYFSQADSNTVVTFNFNDHSYNEANNLVKSIPVGVSLGEDRFGNNESALYLHGHTNSYFILGTEVLLKPAKGTVSMWVKLERKVYAGKGYESNPLLLTRNSSDVDFYDAYAFFYDFKSDRLMIFCTKDSTEQAGVNSIEPFIFNEWMHLAFTYDDNHVAMYINGKKQGEAKKNFPTIFLKDSPVYVSHCASTKNERRSRGLVDDIFIFHRVLNESEIQDLYNAPNPNRVMNIFKVILKWLLVLGLAVALAFLLVWRRRKNLLRAKERLDMIRKLHEMEIRTLKAQMNPHFMFNSLNSIQQFIVSKDNEKAELYLSKFSKLVRKLLESNVNEGLSIKEEVDILTAYIEIESLRFSKSFTYSLRIDERIDVSAKIPHMLVQPFVENAIWHGLLPKKDNRHLEIHFYYESARAVRCVVSDNGVGIDAGKKKEENPEKKSLALGFVKQRLELMKASTNVDCHVEIGPGIGPEGIREGTTVIIVIPILDKP